MWNLPSSSSIPVTCLVTLLGHEGSVLCLDMSGITLLTGSMDGTVRVWDIGDSIDDEKKESHSLKCFRENAGWIVSLKVRIFLLFSFWAKQIVSANIDARNVKVGTNMYCYFHSRKTYPP